MLFPLKKQVIFSVAILFSIITFSQKLQNDKYKLYLTNIIENETTFDKTIKISSNSQYYYEGEIEVRYLTTGDKRTFNFYFSAWDNKYKEFLVKDDKYNIVTPKIFFKSKDIAYIIKEGLNIPTKLLDNSLVENTILSSMIIWLNDNE